jgi:hypothetical protein
MPALIRLPCLMCATLGLAACAPMLSLIGTNQTLVQVVAQIERVKVAGDGVSYVASSKTVTDHALSTVTGSDCKIFNVFAHTPVCATKPATAAADANVQLTANEATPEPAAQAAPETGAENFSPPRDQAAGDE